MKKTKVKYKKSKYKKVSKRDKKLRAKKPGKRKSAAGRTYYETRANRSDLFPSLKY